MNPLMPGARPSAGFPAPTFSHGTHGAVTPTVQPALPQVPQPQLSQLRRIAPAGPGGFPVQRSASGNLAYQQPIGPVVDQTPAAKPDPAKAEAQMSKWKHWGIAAGLLGTALLTHRLPAFKTSFTLFTSDWKDWARMALGVGVINHVNKALDFKPKPWQLGLQTVTALTLVTNGLTNLKGWKNFPLLAVFVPLLVQGTHKLNEFALKKLEERNSKIPHWIPKLLLSVTSTIVGLLTLRKIIGLQPYQQMTGQTTTTTSGGRQVIGAEALACARCGGQHLICMAEVGDMAGTFSAWFKNHNRKEKA